MKEKKEIKAVNRADCSDLRVYLKDNKVDRIVFINKPDATLFPLGEVKLSEMKLKDFQWRIHERPATAEDIFRW